MFKRELKVNLKSFLIWVLIIGSLLVMYFAMYPTFATDTESLEQMTEFFPQEMLEAFGFDISKFSTIMGFYSTEPYMLITILGSVYAAMLGANILSKETSERTTEYLLSKPVTRREVITAKLLAMTTYLTLFHLSIGLISFVSINLIGDFDFDLWLLLTIAPWLMGMLFSYISFFVSMFMKKSRQALSFALAASLGTYFLVIVSRVAEPIDFLKYFSPYEYFDSNYIYDNLHLHLGYVLITVSVILITTVLSYIIYNKKDLD